MRCQSAYQGPSRKIHKLVCVFFRFARHKPPWNRICRWPACSVETRRAIVPVFQGCDGLCDLRVVPKECKKQKYRILPKVSNDSLHFETLKHHVFKNQNHVYFCQKPGCQCFVGKFVQKMFKIRILDKYHNSRKCHVFLSRFLTFFVFVSKRPKDYGHG